MDQNKDIRRAMAQVAAVRDLPSPETTRKNHRSSDPAPAIPGYEIIAEIHCGGQGVVYRAVQISTKRDVAIKVVRGGPLAGASALSRFQREVEVLASLQHPGIVTVHDSGSIHGCSYFVMDYVEGQPLDSWVENCRMGSNRSGATSRQAEQRARRVIELFIKICNAMHAAHVRGIIHRDLKPANIVVDHAHEPRVLDFGLAKLTSDPEVNAGLTTSGQFLGTLPWSSPEQAGGSADRSDIRTDVYSLGVMLYQAFTGRLPYGSGLPWHATAQAIIESSPASPRSHNRHISRDLETIILRCLSKDPNRRYQSADELSRELHRVLAREPIEARRDSTSYVLYKQLARHKLWVAVAAAFVVVVLAGFAVSLVYWRDAESERRVAKTELTKASAINEFLVEMLSSGDPHQDYGSARRVRDVLDDAVATLDAGAFEDQIQVEAAVRETLGSCFESLGSYDKAVTQLKIALQINEKTGNKRRLAENQLRIGSIYLERRELEAAVHFLGRSAGYYQSKDQTSSAYPTVAAALGNAYLLLDRMEDSRRYYELTLELSEENDNPESRFHAMAGLALIARNAGKQELAAALARKAHMLILNANNIRNLGPLLAFTDLIPDFAERRDTLRRVVRIQEEHLGANHLLVAHTHNQISLISHRLGDYDDALAHIDRVEPIYRESFGEKSLPIGTLLGQKGVILCHAGRYEEADVYHVASIAMARDLNLRMDLASGLNNRSLTLRAQKRPSEAEECLREALQILDQLHESGMNWAASGAVVPRSHLGLIMLEQDRFEEAEAVLLKAIPGIDPDDFASAIIGTRLARVRVAQGRFDEARELCEKSLRMTAPGASASSAVFKPGGKVGPELLHDTRREVLTVLNQLYAAWHVASPGSGHDQELAHWREALARFERE